MNVNEKIRTLEKVTGYPVRPDVYEGSTDKYITFTYEDERAALHADDEVQADIAYLQVSLFVPECFNYFEDKRKIKRQLKQQGFQVESVQSWLEDARIGTKRIRRVTFSVNITEAADD